MTALHRRMLARFLAVLVIAFIAELLIMKLLDVLPLPADSGRHYLDAALISIIIMVASFFLIYLPMLSFSSQLTVANQTLQDKELELNNIIARLKTEVHLREQAEQLLNESEERYKSIVDNIGIGVALISPEMKILSMNRQMQAWFPLIKIEDRPVCYEAFNSPPRDRECTYCPTCRTLEDGLMHESVTETPSSGGIINYRIVSSPVKDKKGRVAAAIEMVEDITAKREAEKLLQESESRFRGAFETSAIGMAIVSLDGSWIRVNRSLCEIVGYSEEELLEKTFQDITHPDDLDADLSYIRQLLAGHISYYHMEKRYFHRSGRIVWVLLSVSLVRDTEDRPLHFVSQIEDITERKEAIDKLEQYQQHLEELISKRTSELEKSRASLAEAQALAGLGSWKWNIHEDRVTGSGEFYRIFGRSPEQLLTYQSFIDYLHPDDTGRVLQDVSEALGNRRPYSTEYRIVLPDGQQRFVMARGVVHFDGSGKPDRMVGTVLDITERKTAEGALLRSEAFNRSLIEHLPQRIFIKDRNSIYVSCNNIYAQDLGIRAEEITGRDDFDFYPRELAEAYRADDRAVMESGLIRDIEEQYIQAGEEQWAHTIKVPYRDNEGTIVGVMGIFENITERKMAEGELALRSVISNIFLTLPDQEMFEEILQIILSEMKSAYGVFGYIDEKGDLVVPTMTRFVWDKCEVPEKDIIFPRDQWGDSTWPLALREKRIITLNTPSTNIPGGHIPISRHISLPILYRGESIGLFQVANKETDYTEKDIRLLESIANHVAPVLWTRLQRDMEERRRKRAEEALRRLNEELEQKVIDRTAELESANKELEAFTYSVSHDLRAPLRHLSGYVELLHRKNARTLDEKGVHYLEMISDSARQMGKLVDDLLAFSRMGKAEIIKSRIESDAIVREVIDDVDPADRGRISWVLGALPGIYGDRSMLRLVFSNLILNAVKFSRHQPRPVIEIGSEAGLRGETVFCIRDNGVGFDPKYYDKLFGIFQRLHSTEEFEGTGVGLANVRRIISRHGGRTWAEGAPGKGASFYFSLPGA